jgi:hypothetical protein
MHVQKDIEMGQFNVSVQIDVAQGFQLVPENPLVLDVDMPFLLFVTPNHPNIHIDNPQQGILYRVEDNNGNLVVEEYPIENNQ